MSRELAAIGAQADGIVRSIQKLCARIYGLELRRAHQREILHAFRKALNEATRYNRGAGPSLETEFGKEFIQPREDFRQ